MCETYLSAASSQQLLTWLSLSLLLMFAPPRMYYCSIKGNNVGKNPTSSLPSHGIMTSYNRIQGHEDKEKKKKKKSCQNTGRQKCQVKLG